MAFACKGISLLVKASPAGLRSSVFVSPATLKTIHLITCGSFSFLLNQSAFAQLCKTSLACGLFLLSSAMVWKLSCTKIIFFNTSAASLAMFSSFKASIKTLTLYPPNIVPSILKALFLSIFGALILPLSIEFKNSHFTKAASSTPGFTLFSKRFASSSLFSFSSNLQSSLV